ncbi:MAG: enoyl-CoA hydratase/isomerase family protein [Planctomycetota bacterium]
MTSNRESDMIMPSDAIEVKVAEPVATVVLNRPDRCNALTRSMILELREAFRDLYLEKRVRAIVLTGAGKGFCGGRDLNEMARATQAVGAAGLAIDPSIQAPPSPDQWGEEATEFRDLVLEMLELPKPIIASVNGAAAACGAGLVLASDIVIAGPQSSFGLPDPQRGLVAGVATPLLSFRLGAGPAARLLLSAQMITADEALRLGIYHEIVADELLWARAAEIGDACAGSAPEAIGLTKRLLLETAGEQLATQFTSGVIATATSRTTDAAKEGIGAFVNRQHPSWKPSS